MIPRILWLYWYGPSPPSWLRRQTITTFQRHNPDWDLRPIWDTPGTRPRVSWWWPEMSPDMPPDARSDVMGWAALHAEGGFVVDYDVLFLRPIPRESLSASTLLVTSDGGTPEALEALTKEERRALRRRFGPSKQRAFAIGLLGAPPGDPLVALLDAEARRRAKAWTPGDHQACGSRMLSEVLSRLEKESGRKAINLPSALLYPQGFQRAENHQLWLDDPVKWSLDPLLGLHWGGGHETSRRFDQEADEHWAKTSKCVVARAWRRAMGVES